MLLEEVLTGTEVSVEAVTVDGRTTVVGITDKSVAGPPAFVESGHMFPAGLPPTWPPRSPTSPSTPWPPSGSRHGLSHTEVMVTPAGPRLVELNPRQGGGYIFDLVHLVTGTHPLRLLVDLALGERRASARRRARRRGGRARRQRRGRVRDGAPRGDGSWRSTGSTASPPTRGSTGGRCRCRSTPAAPSTTRRTSGTSSPSTPAAPAPGPTPSALVGSLRLRFADGRRPSAGVAVGVTERPAADGSTTNGGG